MKKRYLLRVMRLLIIFMLAGLMHVTAATYSQTVTIKGRNLTLAEVFKEITEQTGYEIGGYGNVLQSAKAVTVDFEDVALPEAMRRILAGQQIDFAITDKTIIIKEAPRTVADVAEAGARVPRVPNEHLILAIPTVTGRITDTLVQPLSGASVVVLSPDGKRTSLQTTTKANGIFVLENVPEGAMLRISFMGYVEQEVQARAQMGNVMLKPSESPLDEVQVMAYGTTSRRLSTGNIGTVKAKDIEKQPVTNPLLAIQGRIPGLVITQQTGVPGGGVKVRIQGQNSINSGNAPLFVVDGVPIESYLPALNSGTLLGSSGTTRDEGNPLNYLNPTDIESIDVLKDADATAIFGSRAANGAILITTKKGRIGQMQLDVGVHTGWARAPYDGFKMLNTRQYLDMRYEAYRNDGIDWRASNVNAPDLKLWDTTRNVNWQKELLQGTALTQNIRAGVSGGNGGMQYRLSGTYDRSGTIFPDNGNGNPKFSLSSSLTSTTADSRLSLSWTTNYQYNHNELPGGNFLEAAILLPPHAPDPFNADGTINWAPAANGSSTYLQNPYIQISNVYTNTTANLISNLALGYKLGRHLELSANVGFNNMDTEDFRPRTSSSIQPESRSFMQNQGVYGDRVLRSWIAEPQLRYAMSTLYGKFDVLIGNTLRESNNRNETIIGINYPSDALLENVGSAASLSPGGTFHNQYKYMAYFGRFNYNLGDEFIINVNARRDGSSRFGENKRFANFWSAAGVWIFSNQGFVKYNLPWFSFGKLRVSYGITGNDQIDDYQFSRTYGSYNSQIPYQGIGGLQSFTLPNPELQWEEVRKFSLGLDMGFINDRILLNVGYSQNETNKQLLGYNLSSVTGATSMSRNWDATTRNTTWEFSISTLNIKEKDFEWTTMFNTSIARNILADYPGLEQSPYRNSLIVGKPIDLVRLRMFGGVNAATGVYQYLDNTGQPTSFPATPEDTKIVSFMPPFYGGLQNSFRWKSLSLDFFMQFTKTRAVNFQYYNGLGNITPGVFYMFSGGNQPTTVLNRWRQPGDQANVARFSSILGNGAEWIAGTDAWYKDASFARLKNVSLSWQVPTVWIKRLGLKSASFMTSGQNLFTLTDYDGPDPETPSLSALPPLRVFTLGINVVF